MHGEKLTLDMLSSNDSLEEDFLMEDAGTAFTRDLDRKDEDTKDKDKNKDINQNFFSEEDTDSPESVADKDKDTPGNAKPSPGSDSKISQIYSSLAAHLNESGVLPSLNKEKKIQSIDDIQEAISQEIESRFTEAQKAYNDAINRGEPEDVYLKYMREKEQLDNISEESISDVNNTKLRFNIIAQDFLNKGFSREDAMKYAKRSQDLGEDITDAKQAIDRIKEFNDTSYQNIVKQKKAEQQEAIDKISSFVKGTDEIIKGIKLTPTTKEELLKQMTTPIGKDKQGNPITKYGKALVDDPVKTKTITEYMFMLTKGFTDFSKINTLVSSKNTREIDDLLRSTGADFLNSGKVNFDNKDDNSSFSINDDFMLDD